MRDKSARAQSCNAKRDVVRVALERARTQLVLAQDVSAQIRSELGDDLAVLVAAVDRFACELNEISDES